ncbi:beta-glucosidase [Mycetocola tolaasinivorans]|uniref:Beta-glucosidase n=1 Tax=Mycetocola tolaasinivorans TaxID=76635 RepID=A0A3L7A8Y4_9MICO|nr:GH1 family beta-glucosidase [Mycetocola tolaasinivorans]RLP76813.1 beta-glucosidase [Mycetocola tolaasinivorans]
MSRRSEFPADFVWSSATAAYQVEGAVAREGRGPSIWDTFAARPGTIADGSTGEVAIEHFDRFAADIDLMAGLGLNGYRYSLSWSRIQPDGRGAINRAGLDHYRRVAEALRERAVTPWVTLYHWDLPQPLEDAGGWLARDTAARFAEFAGIVATELGDVVGDWMTLNEPWCSAFLGYASGVHAPGRTEGARSLDAVHHLLLGHGLGTATIRAAAPDARVGIAVNLYSVRAASDTAADLDAARRIDGLSNRLFLEPLFRGQYPQDVLRDAVDPGWEDRLVRPGDTETIAAPLDFLGINYYSRHTVAGAEATVTSAGTDPSGTASTPEASAYPGSEGVRFVGTAAPRTQMGWEIHPDGLVDVLRQAHGYARDLPLYVTENGSAYADEVVSVAGERRVHDPERTAYLAAHVDACLAAISEGLPLRGYTAWSILDNFEWAWGYQRRFGLVYVDYDTQERILKDSARWLADFLAEREPAAPVESA